MGIAVIFGGTRPNGNTELLTKRILRNLEIDWIDLNEYRILPIQDQRHAPEGFQELGDDYSSIMRRVMQHDILIFSTPIYWYSMSGLMKNFIDRWSQTLREPEYKDFKNSMSKKKAFVIAVGGDSPHLKGLPLIQQFHYIFDFVQLPFSDYIIGNANKPGDIFNDEQALFAADRLNESLKIMTEE
ncbi:flavodoxin family protein [Bacillus sp. FJAT-42376]|uniref:flavodoxin family protein n=1 Tax=Bacillus sp. FJAT-42376 TaxID=2014076 RepID=UPI000F4EC576|nr:flavodoxin family protein [Bacillus sp. FJAT-42376]AZB44489.1 flavodoxin family protein [Bacillus sp. FJAT-42376]